MTDAPREAAAFVDWLVTKHPTLAPIHEEHLSDNFGDSSRTCCSET